ncbi:chorismate mutase [Paenibacillus sp. FSL K6-0276]|uniref:chorismate mutase n=1 Tax=Paenibacillus sp. FSL K6-0276 TaxID=2921450 RepID=UPI0030EC82D6
MKHMTFIRPTEHYDQQIIEIDEQICALIKQRKERSDNNPGFPPFEYISDWAAKFELYEDFLKAVFGTLFSEDHFKPMVEPTGFRKHIAVLQSIEADEFFYTLTSIRQYSNASVITLSMDWDITSELYANKPNHFELYIGEAYDCRMTNGGSSSGHAAYNYVVSPPLPDDISGIKLEFKEFSVPLKKDGTGTGIVFKLE